MAKDKDEIDLTPAEDGQVYVDRSQIDFDPNDGLYTGTLVDGSSEIPGAQQNDENLASSETPGEQQNAEEDSSAQ